MSAPVDGTRGPLNEIRNYLRQVRDTTTASGLYGRALRLSEVGNTVEAFELTRQALELIPESDEASPPAAALLVVGTTLYAQLAATLERQAEANDAIRRAIRVGSAFGDVPDIQRYVVWLRQQLLNSP